MVCVCVGGGGGGVFCNCSEIGAPVDRLLCYCNSPADSDFVDFLLNFCRL